MRTRFDNRAVGYRNVGRALCDTFLLSLLALSFPEEGAAQKSPNAFTTADAIEILPVPDSLTEKKRNPLDKNPNDLVSSHALTDVRTAIQSQNLVVSILSEGQVSHEEFVLHNPPRLVVDFPGVENKIPFPMLPINAAKVKQLRIRQFQSGHPRITRMVFDLEDEIEDYKILDDAQSIRILFPDSSPAPKSSPARTNMVASITLTETKREKDHPTPVTSRVANSTAIPKKAEPERKVAPVINDLSSSEIPLSTRGTGSTVEAKPRQTLPAPKEVPTTAPLAPPPPTPTRSPVLTLSPTQDTRFTGHPLTLDLVQIPLVDFFRLMAEEGGINIVMDPEIVGNISIKVVKVPWDQIFEAALLNNGLDKQIEGNLVRIARKSTLQGEATQLQSLKKATLLAAETETRFIKLNYAKASAFLQPLTEQKTVRGVVTVDERTNQLVLTDIPSSLDNMQRLLSALDIPQPQVEIEARIVSATRDFARDIGVQFGFVEGNLERVTVGGPNTFGTIGGTRPMATPISTFAGGNTATGRGSATSTSSASAGVSTGSDRAGNLSVNLPATRAFGGVGLSIGNIFDTFLLDAAITAGETKGLAKLISQPKVTAQNNQAATITQGLRFPVQIVANNTVTVQFQSAALTLQVTPQITYEGNVILDLRVENNTPDFGRTVNGIPSIRTSESTTRVLVSDGGTTVIGGILIDNEANQEERVPGLASLPILGNLFKRASVSRSVQEVLFFITPRIVK